MFPKYVSSSWALIYDGFRRTDWRFWSVIVATCIAIGITAFIPSYDESALDPAKFFGAFYASWAAGVALFGLVGFFVAVTSLVRPDQEHFDVRARNLLRRQSGPHIDYVLGRLKEIVEPYIEHTEKRYIVQSYHENDKKFFVNHVTKTELKGFFDDISNSFTGSVAYQNGSSPPDGGEPCCLTYVRVNGLECGKMEEFVGSFKRTFKADIPRRGACILEHRLNYWVVESDEANRHIPLRYTRSMDIIVENNLSRRSIIVDVVSPLEKIGRYEIAPGQSRSFLHLLETAPSDSEVYDFRIRTA